MITWSPVCVVVNHPSLATVKQELLVQPYYGVLAAHEGSSHRVSTPLENPCRHSRCGFASEQAARGSVGGAVCRRGTGGCAWTTAWKWVAVARCRRGWRRRMNWAALTLGCSYRRCWVGKGWVAWGVGSGGCCRLRCCREVGARLPAGGWRDRTWVGVAWAVGAWGFTTAAAGEPRRGVAGRRRKQAPRGSGRAGYSSE